MIDQYLMNMRFAEELLQFLYCEAPLFECKTRWTPRYFILEFENEINDSFFYEDVGMSVFYIATEKVDDIFKCYEDFLKEINGPIDHFDTNFTNCALNIAPLYFSKGYNHGSFLGYCAMVMGVAYNFLYLEPNGVPQRACQVIGLVLFMHQMTGEFYREGGWTGLLDVSLSFNECIENPKRKQKRKH